MSDILSDSEIVDIERFQEQRRRHPVPEDAWLYVAEIDRLIASHRTLAAERDNLKEVNQGIIDGIRDGKAILGERIRTLESACEIAIRRLQDNTRWWDDLCLEVHANDFQKQSFRARAQTNTKVVEQLEGAIKNG